MIALYSIAVLGGVRCLWVLWRTREVAPSKPPARGTIYDELVPFKQMVTDQSAGVDVQGLTFAPLVEESE